MALDAGEALLDANTTHRTRLSTGPDDAGDVAACLVVIHGEGMGKRIDIGSRPIVIGRSHDADLHIGHGSVSRQHCRVWREQGACYIQDLGATNPTRVNGIAIDTSALSDGDHLVIGESILKFIGEGSVEARYHEEVYQVVTHDTLTQLYNRRHFCETADKEIARSQRRSRPLCLCIIDVDLFKPVNDLHGHIAGDNVLYQIGAVIRAQIRHEDIAARIGGEEFAILLPETDLAAAEHFAERLREAVAHASFELKPGLIETITVSIGVARLDEKTHDRSLLMTAADSALYRAKAEGRNTVRIANPP